MHISNLTVELLIEKLGLEPLPDEGGLFRQTYISSETIPARCLPSRYPRQDKAFGTAIFYLLTDAADSFSALHRLLTDEVYHYYLGDPLEVTLLYPDGTSQRVQLGHNILEGQQLQFVVPAGTWQGMRVAPGGSYGLIGTTMSPGYANEDFQLGQRSELLAQYPQERDPILALTRG